MSSQVLDRAYWLARLVELKDDLLTGKYSERVYQARVSVLKKRARLSGVEL